tara:strand:+ start:47484 stop:48704 length:1221 start_codon:yes stop_codon:yes gene_type:complete
MTDAVDLPAGSAGEQTTSGRPSGSSNWWAIFSMMLGVAALISAELLPVSMLTQMAEGLSISAGVAGQMISVTAATAMMAGLLIPGLFKQTDRRRLILCFTAMMIVACLITAAAQSIWLLMASRVVLGIAIGGFWALLTAVAMQLVPAARVAAAFSIIFSGVSLALVVAAPLGSYLGGLYGWRVVFVAVALIAVAVLLLQWLTLPSVAGGRQESTGGMGEVLTRPGVKLAFLAMLLSFTGNQMLYIYMRPYMEHYLNFNIEQISFSWVLFGIASFVGATFTGVLAHRAFKQILVGMPLAMLVVALLLLAGAQMHWLAYLLIAIWGFFGAVLPIIWSTWITKALPDAADSAGGLYSAALQVAAIGGAMISGALIDLSGISTNLITTAALMAITLVLTLLSLRVRHADN